MQQQWDGQSAFKFCRMQSDNSSGGTEFSNFSSSLGSWDHIRTSTADGSLAQIGFHCKSGSVMSCGWPGRHFQL